ncbi:small capsid protein [Bovine alphaherpesvirus 2]|uniref:Small capsomere-interacting protein n=1 Tax=Bovine alphaherpesvirus 2 TaxID=10295 RepID=A0A7T1L7L4_9ALPH|nr:small capsid protein [Bovine alphaherpesvirus 2]
MEFHRPDTITVDGVRDIPLRDIVLRVNNSRRLDHTHDHPLGNQAAVRYFIRGQAAALAQLGMDHANNTLAPQPMFYWESQGRWLRPSFGLKRTFSPFIARDPTGSS